MLTERFELVSVPAFMVKVESGNMNSAHSRDSFPQLETERCLLRSGKQRLPPGHITARTSHGAGVQPEVRSLLTPPTDTDCNNKRVRLRDTVKVKEESVL